MKLIRFQIYIINRKEIKMSNCTVVIDRKNLYSKDYSKIKYTNKEVSQNVKISESLVNVFIHMIKKSN